MAKVFRLFSDKDLQNWEDRGEAYGPSVIENIPNPDGDYSKKEPTSIPSPFSRMDLVRTAFKYVVENGNLAGNTIYHKLVSDSFDVGEMFFKIDSLGAKAQIKTWNKYVDLPKLTNSTNKRHQLYGETLGLFLKQDRETYNFDKLNRLFFILYDHKIIGGTSPITLFFTSANNLDFTNIRFGNDTLFDKDFKPLYQRDREYQMFIYCFFSAYREAGLTSKMKDVSDYLDKNLKLLDKENHSLYEEIHNLKNQDAETIHQNFELNYDSLDTGISGDLVEIIGCNLKKKKRGDGSDIEQSSSFVIKSFKYSNGRKPLVLQNGFSQRLTYTYPSVKWDPTIIVPIYDPESDLNKRKLPGQLDIYPYLTISDFLEPYLIRLVYPINKAKYFDGNIKYETGDIRKNYILPISKRFFDFFDTSDLMTQMPDGKSMFEMVAYSGSVDVIFRIPIKANAQYITFKRTYENKGVANPAEPDIENNKGYIIENQFGLTIYPFIRTTGNRRNFYRVMLIDRDISAETRHHNYDLSFFQNSNNQQVRYTDKKTRSLKERDNVTSSFFVLENEFDYIQVTLGNDASGLIVPLFPKAAQGTNSFTFAIDFGTTNTHIEYKIDNGNPKPFEITQTDVQTATLHDPQIEQTDPGLAGTGAGFIYSLIPHEFLPEFIGKEFDFKFPQRTVISEHKTLNPNTATYSLADFNIPFVYEKQSKQANARISTNLKWSNYTLSDEHRKRVEHFFENLIFLIRNKVLLNGGNLDSTKLIWFYPSSMMTVRRASLENIWKDLFSKYITRQSIPIKLSESIAPFYYFKSKGGIDASDLPVAAIDIGGGTSDIVIYQQNKPQILTSFRFAANSIFGDAFNGSPDINGFVIKYYAKINKLLQDNSLPDLQKALTEIREDQDSEDIIAFFFSIENNKVIKQKNIPISFNKILSNDDDLKIIFVTFYAALIYHLAKLMKVKNLKPPRYLTFSGTGSKIINIADSSIDLASLQKLTRLIFEKVYESPVNTIELKQHSEPKEITCKGGLLSDATTDIDDIKTVLLGNKENTLIPDENISYTQVYEEKTLTSIVEETKTFIDLLFSLHKDFNFSDKFGVNPAYMQEYQTILKEDLMQYLKSGLENKTNELFGNININVEEPLFFYPLVGAINKLAFKIVTKINK